MGKFREGGFLISKIKQISERIFDKKLRRYGIGDLNTAQGRIIFSLWQHDNMPITELARRTALGKTTLTSMLDRLEQSGYIVSKVDEKDKRKTIIALSEKSRGLEKRYADVSKEMTDLFYEGLSEEQVDEFEGSLKRILGNLTKYEVEHK
ncbi:MAG: MarR family transcriptional regulator [Chloroflexi bacterium]|nr:MarR family transcriptional regulator [Chloroflexota bacterium]